MYMPERSQTEIFADNLSRILANKNMSQNQLSKKIEVSAMSVNAWCRGLSMPRNDKIDRMCQVLNVTRNDLLQDKAAAPNLSVPAAHPVRILGAICAGDGLRHTYASMLIKDGVPVSEVSAQLGHASVDITLRVYTHLFTEASTASKAISDAINAKWAPKGHPKQNKEAPDVEISRASEWCG